MAFGQSSASMASSERHAQMPSNGIRKNREAAFSGQVVSPHALHENLRKPILAGHRSTDCGLLGSFDERNEVRSLEVQSRYSRDPACPSRAWHLHRGQRRNSGDCDYGSN